MELMTYFRLFRKWIWLIALGAFLAGGAAFLRSSGQPDLYRARVMIKVGTAIDVPNPDYSMFRMGQDLTPTYAVLARSYDIVAATVDAGGFPVSVGELQGAIGVNQLENTSLLEIFVTYTDPVLASDMANEIARQLLLKNPSNLTPEQEELVRLQTEEINRLEQELAQTRLELSRIDSQIALTTDPDELASLRDQRNTVVDQINQASQNIALLTNTITGLQQRVNSLEIVERARPNIGPMRPNVFMQSLFGAIVGAALAVGLILLLEYLDDTIGNPAEATQLLSMPTLASITRFGKPRDNYEQRLITYRDPGSPISEEYRTLRTNLLFSANGSADKSVFIVTSPGPSEGKSVTSSNLAVTMAMAGWRVLLIDADLRRPRLHDAFGLENNVGLSTLLSIAPEDLYTGALDSHGLIRNLDDCMQETDIPGLRVMTSGHIPLNPTEVLGSASMQRWYQEFQARDDIDIVLFDSPPALVVADSSVLASAIEAPVVLVVQANGTRRGAALTAKEQFQQLNVKVAGLVLNSVNPRDRGGYGYGYNYYYYYYYSNSNIRSSSPN